jgi:hypothetical protein
MVEIYNSKREQLINSLFSLQRLEEEGKDMENLPQEAWDEIVHQIEEEDARKLAQVRDKLKTQPCAPEGR